MKLKFTFLITFLLIGISNYAQQRSCGYVAYMQEKLQDPQYKVEYEELQAEFQIEYERLLANPQERLQTIFIPVAVHYPEGDESNRTCLEDLARDQIRILNEDFLAINDDITDWDDAKAEYPGVNIGSIDVQFVLATRNHPTNGIDPDIVEGGPAVTVGNSVQDSDTRWAGYQNFVVKDIGALGYSPLGGQPSIGGSVVMDNSAFGSGTGCPDFKPGGPFNLGRTVTHELGHFYNLDHTWGGNGSCASDDRVEDTPNISGPSSGCNTPGSVVMCGNKSLTTNYMDYVHDKCMFMFTEGQTTRMNAYINTIKDDWKTDEVLSLDSFEINKVYSIYPNPANNEINISLISNAVKEASYEVFDIIGKSIFKGDLNLNTNNKSGKINTSELTNGVYLLKINSSGLSATKKIVIKH